MKRISLKKLAELEVRFQAEVDTDLEFGLYSDGSPKLRISVEQEEPPSSRPELEVSLMWDCEKSPIGFCEYLGDEDPAHDHCVHCGDPEERK